MLDTKQIETAVARVLAQLPSFFYRDREVFSDTFSGPQIATAGPYDATIAAQRPQLSLVGKWDEKGSVSQWHYLLVGIGLPITVSQTLGNVVSEVVLFALNDVIRDKDGNRFIVVEPPFRYGNIVQVALELRG
jgi:hypothetical protein